MRRLVFLAAKAAVSAALLYLAFRSVKMEMVGARLAQLHYPWLAAAIGLLVLQIVPFGLRWQQIVLAAAIPFPTASALRFSFIAAFFNQALPSTVGGDAVRIWLLGRAGASWKAATHSVLIDRVAGLIALALLVLVCLPWTFDLVRQPAGRATLIFLEALSLSGVAVFLFLGAADWSWTKRWWPTRQVVEIAASAYRTFTGARLPLIAVLSLTIHFVTVAAVWCVAHAISAPLGFSQALMLVLPVILVATIPISIGGWGVRESAMMTAFTYAGLPEADGLVVSILFGLSSLAAAALGGLVWIASADQRAAWTSKNRSGKNRSAEEWTAKDGTAEDHAGR